MNKNKIVIFGAGNIGCGFIGRIFSKAGFNVCFVDINEKTIAQMNKDKSYIVEIAGEDYSNKIIVDNVCAIDGRDADKVANAVMNTDLIATSVGAGALKAISKSLAAGLSLRIKDAKPINILLCENLIDADKHLRNFVKEHIDDCLYKDLENNVGFIRTSIGPSIRTKIGANGSISFLSEAYEELPIDKHAIVGEMPRIKNLVPFAPFDYYIERKLFMHNMAHALTAYLGSLLNDKEIWQTVNRPDARKIIRKALSEPAKALAKEYGIELAELEKFADDLIHRFGNKALGDPISRVGRDTVRKLGENDRLIGPLKLCVKHNINPTFLMVGIAAALHFQTDGDPASYDVAFTAKTNGIQKTLAQYSNLGPEYETCLKTIDHFYKMFAQNSGLSKIIKSADDFSKIHSEA